MLVIVFWRGEVVTYLSVSQYLCQAQVDIIDERGEYHCCEIAVAALSLSSDPSGRVLSSTMWDRFYSYLSLVVYARIHSGPLD